MSVALNVQQICLPEDSNWGLRIRLAFLAAKRSLSKLQCKSKLLTRFSVSGRWIWGLGWLMRWRALPLLSTGKKKKGFSGYTNRRSIHPQGPVALWVQVPNPLDKCNFLFLRLAPNIFFPVILVSFYKTLVLAKKTDLLLDKYDSNCHHRDFAVWETEGPIYKPSLQISLGCSCVFALDFTPS